MPTGTDFKKMMGDFSASRNAKIKEVVAAFLSFSIIFSTLYLLPPAPAKAAAGVPQIMSYQGRLTDSSGNLLGGAGTQYFFKFSIWDDPAVGQGSQLWPAGSPGIASSTVVNGVFNFDIGDTANGFPDALTYDFNSNANVYLQVQVSASAGGSYETLAPRQRIDSSGFAINAQSLSNLITSSGIANLATTTLANLTVSGTSTFAGLSAMQLLTFTNSTGTSLSLSGAGNALQVTAGTSVLQGMTFTNATGTSATIGSVLYSSAGIVPGASFTVGTSSKDLTLQGATTTLASASGDNVVISAGGKVSVSSGNVDISAGALTLNGITRIDNAGQATFATTTISNLSLTNPLAVSSGGSGGSGPFTRGILIASGTSVFQTLSSVADGKVLVVSSTAPLGYSFEVASSTGGSGITSLDGLIASSQTFSTSTNYSESFIISSAGSNHRFNFPGRINDINNLATSTGSIIVGSGSSWAALLAGTNGYVLTASSSAANGIAWQPAAATGITSLNGSASSTQTFATIGNITITTSNGIHTFQVTTPTTTISAGGTTVTGNSFTLATSSNLSGLSINGTTFTLATSSATTNGFLTASDFLNFSNKQGVTTTIAAGGTTITGPAFTLATTTNYAGGFNIQGATFNFPGRLKDIDNLATTTGNLIFANGTTWTTIASSSLAVTSLNGLQGALTANIWNATTTVNGLSKAVNLQSASGTLNFAVSGQNVNIDVATNSLGLQPNLNGNYVSSLNGSTGAVIANIWNTTTTISPGSFLSVTNGGIGNTTINLNITPVSSTRAVNTTGFISGGGDLSADRTLSLTIAPVSSTRAINTSGFITGGGDLSADRTLSLTITPVSSTRAINTGFGLQGGGDLSADRTLYFGGTFSTSSNLSGLTISSSSATWTFTLATSSATTNGFLTASDWLNFNGKSSTTINGLTGAITGANIFNTTTTLSGSTYLSVTNGGVGNTTINLNITPVSSTRQIIAGSGLLGGGDLSADRTIYWNPSVSTATITTATTTGLYFTEATGTDLILSGVASSTAFQTGALQFNNATGTNIRVSLATTTNLYFGSATGSVAFFTTASSTNFQAGNIQFQDATGSNLLLNQIIANGSSTINNLNFTSATGTSLKLSSLNSGGSTYAASISLNGNINLASGANNFSWISGPIITAPLSGSVLFRNSAQNDFTSLLFGGTSSSYLSLKFVSSTQTFAFRNATDTADASISAASGTFSGNVGVGTSNPSSTLQVVGSSTFSSGNATSTDFEGILNVQGTNRSSSGAELLYLNNGSNNTSWGIWGSAGTVNTYTIGQKSTGGDIQFGSGNTVKILQDTNFNGLGLISRTSGNAAFGTTTLTNGIFYITSTSAPNAFDITSSGNVGIGTTTAQTALVVLGTTTLQTLVASASSTITSLNLNEATGTRFSIDNLFPKTSNGAIAINGSTTISNALTLSNYGTTGCLAVTAGGLITTSTCSGASGVSSLNGLTNGVNLTSPSSTLNIGTSGQNITLDVVTSSLGLQPSLNGTYVTSLNGATGTITANIWNSTTTLVAGTGISVSNGGIGNTTVTNTAPNFNTTTTLSSNSSFITFSNGGVGNTALSLFITPVSSTRAINTGFGLQGGGDLSADRTLYFGGTFSTSSNLSGLTISSSSATWTFTLATSSATTNGFLTASDWLNFNGKSSTTINGLTGAITGANIFNTTTTVNGLSNAVNLQSASNTLSFAVSGQNVNIDVTTATLGLVPNSRQVLAGSNLQGGGALTGDITLYWNPSVSTATITTATTTNLFFTNATGSSLMASTATIAIATTTGLYFVNATGTNMVLSGVASSSNFQTGGLQFGNATGTNLFISGVASSTAFQTGALQFNNATGTNLKAGLALFTTASSTNFQAGNIQFQDATGSNLLFTTASGTNFQANNLQFANATGTNIKAGLALFTTASSTNFQTGNIQFQDATGSNLRIAQIVSTGSSTLVSLNFTEATGTRFSIDNLFPKTSNGAIAINGSTTISNALTLSNYGTTGCLAVTAGGLITTSTCSGASGVSSLNGLTNGVNLTSPSSTLNIGTSGQNVTLDVATGSLGLQASLNGAYVISINGATGTITNANIYNATTTVNGLSKAVTLQSASNTLSFVVSGQNMNIDVTTGTLGLVPNSRQVLAGSNLQGGGNLSGDITLYWNPSVSTATITTATTTLINFTTATGTNLFGSSLIFTTGTISVATTTGLYFTNATGTNAFFSGVASSTAFQTGALQFNNATGTNLQAFLGFFTTASSTNFQTNNIQFANATGTNLLVSMATATNLWFGNATGSTSFFTTASSTNFQSGGLAFGNATGTNIQWVSATSSGTTYLNNLTIQGTCIGCGTGSANPSGSDTQIQYNNGGAFAGDANFTWSSSTKNLSVASATITMATTTNLWFASATGTTISLTASGTTGLILNGVPKFNTSSSLLRLGPYDIAKGNATGTFVGANIPAFAGDFVNFQVASATKLRVDSSGNIGIGTSTAPDSLSIYTNAANTNPAVGFYNQNTGGLYQIAATGTSLQFIDKAQNTVSFQINQSATLGQPGAVYFGTTTNIAGNSSQLFVYGGSSGANIDVMGNSAITAGDQAFLELEGSDYQTGNGGQSSVALRYYGPTALGTTAGFNNKRLAFLDFGDASTSLIGSLSSRAVPLIFVMNNAEVMRLTASGSLGIGTQFPSSTLQVIGNTSTTQIFASAFNFTTGTISVATITGLYFTNATGTNMVLSGVASSSAFQTPALSFNNATGTNAFFSGVASSTSFQAGALQFNNATGTNILITGIASSTKLNTAFATSSVLTISASGTPALFITGIPQSTSASALISLGGYNIAGGASSGTWIGLNTPLATTTDFINFQVTSTSKFRVDNTGNIIFAGTASGTAIALTGSSTISNLNISSATGTLIGFVTATGTNLFGSSLLFTTGTISVATTTGIYFTNATGTNLVLSGVASSSVFQTPALSFNNATGTNAVFTGVASSTAFQTGALQFNNATGTNIKAGLALFTTASSTNFQTGNIQFQDATGSNLKFTTATGTTLVVGNLTVQGTCSNCASGSSPGSPTNSIQYNNGGTFGGDSNLVWSSSTANLTLASATITMATTTQLWFGNATGSALFAINVSSTNLSGNGFQFNNATGTNLKAALGLFTTASATNFQAGNIQFQDATGSNLKVTNLTVSSCSGCGGGSPGGSTNALQFNNGGSLGGDNSFSIVSSTDQLILSPLVSGGGETINTTSTGLGLVISASSTPTNDLMQISNSTSTGAVTQGTNALQITYYGGTTTQATGALENGALRINLIPGASSAASSTTWEALRINMAPTATTTVNMYGIKFDDVNGGAGGLGTEVGIYFGKGFDRSIQWTNTTSTLYIPNSTGTLWRIQNGSSTLLQMRQITGGNTQPFGGIVSADAFESKTSYFGEEFNLYRPASCPLSNSSSTLLGRGSIGNPGSACAANTGELTVLTTKTANITTSSAASVLNGLSGIERLTATTTAATQGNSILENLGGSAVARPTLMFGAGNRPTVTMKIKTNFLTATTTYMVGLGDKVSSTLGLAAAGNVAPNNGIYFSNCTGNGSATCGATWNGVVSAAGVVSSVSCTGNALVTGTSTAYLKIEVRATNDVHFYVDRDVSDGVQETECGTGVSTNIPTNQLSMMLEVGSTISSGGTAVLDVDYFRVWQDDSATPAPTPESTVATDATSTIIEPDFASNSSLGQLFQTSGGVSDYDLVSLDPLGATSTVVRSNQPYDPYMVGIAVSDGGLSMDNDTITAGKRVVTAGRTYVNVTNENGNIEPGDYLTSSGEPGVAMKATKAGFVIGQALSAYSDFAIGQVLILIRPTSYHGPSFTSLLPSGFTATSGLDISRAVLENMLNTSTTPQSEIVTDRLAAAVEIISPQITASGLTIDHIASLNDAINFQNDVVFFGRPYFNQDTAGFAVVKTGDKSVDVTFSQEYLEQPIVNATISMDDTASADSIFSAGLQYIVTNKSTKGFTIILNKAAPVDVNFSWTAFAVKNAKIFLSTPDSTQATAQTTTTPNLTTTSTDTTSSGSGGTATDTTNGTTTTTDTSVSAATDTSMGTTTTITPVDTTATDTSSQSSSVLAPTNTTTATDTSVSTVTTTP